MNGNSRRKTLVPIAAVALAAVAGGAWFAHAKLYPEWRARSLLGPVLYDVDSAKLSAVEVGPEGALCGAVNAKNRMGAYVGWRRFFATGPAVEIEPEEPRSTAPLPEKLSALEDKIKFLEALEGHCPPRRKVN